QTVIALGHRGRWNREVIAAGERRLLDWIKANPAYQAAGDLIVMGYNSPMTTTARQFFEIQLPVEKATQEWTSVPCNKVQKLPFLSRGRQDIRRRWRRGALLFRASPCAGRRGRSWANSASRRARGAASAIRGRFLQGADRFAQARGRSTSAARFRSRR